MTAAHPICRESPINPGGQGHAGECGRQVAEGEAIDRADTLETRRLKWTRREYYQIFEMGLLQGRRVELIGGELFEMSPQNSPHSTSIVRVLRALNPAFASGYFLRPQLPLLLGSDSDPEPDVAVIKGEPDDYAAKHPSTAALVVEVADSSLEHDRKHKASLYARAGIPEYWIVNVSERKLEVRRRPAPTPGTPFGHDYTDVQSLGPEALISALEAPGVRIQVSGFFPKRP